MSYSKPRLYYIDAMRALAVVFIVFGHIPMYCYRDAGARLESFRDFTSMAQVPMFFFISGFLFNARRIFDNGGGKLFVVDKIRQLVVPAALFGSLYVWMSGGDFMSLAGDQYKAGYWFTFSLFEYVMIMAAVEWIARRCNINELSWRYAAMACAAMAVAFVLYIPAANSHFGIATGLLQISLMRHFIYYALGRLTRLHITELAQRETLTQSLSVVAVAVFALTFIIGNPFGGLAFHLWTIASELSVLALVFVMFHRHRDYFARQGKLNCAICFVGRRTLDIYLLHYFFMPKDMSAIGEFFTAHPAPILEAVFSLTITLAVMAVCLFTSEMLRGSKTITRYALGGK